MRSSDQEKGTCSDQEKGTAHVPVHVCDAMWPLLHQACVLTCHLDVQTCHVHLQASNMMDCKTLHHAHVCTLVLADLLVRWLGRIHAQVSHQSEEYWVILASRDDTKGYLCFMNICTHLLLLQSPCNCELGHPKIPRDSTCSIHRSLFDLLVLSKHLNFSM